MGDLTFSTLNATNIRRAHRWHPDGLDSWSVSDWLLAFAGEAGEAANAGKKYRRLLDGLQQSGHVPEDLDAAIDAICDELADAVIYADIAATVLGRRLSDAVIRKFNAISEREGFPERLQPSGEMSDD